MPAMRIAIQAFGTRGDVQPYVALALGLMREGHSVQLAAPVQYAALPQQRGVPFAPLPMPVVRLSTLVSEACRGSIPAP